MSIHVYSGTISGPYKDAERINQDSLAYLQENGYTVIAVADGAGSLKSSHIGSNLAANTAVNVAMDQLISGCDVEESLYSAVEEARSVLVGRDDSKDVGCTLVVGIITDDQWGVVLVGDSFAVASYPESHDLIEREQDSEFINQTKLLTSHNHDPLYLVDDSEIIALTIATDGLYHASTQKNQASVNFWNPLISMAEKGKLNINDFLSFMNDKEKIEDDTTMIIAVKDNKAHGE